MMDDLDRAEELRQKTSVDCLLFLHEVLGERLKNQPNLNLVIDGADTDAVDIDILGRIFRIHVEDLGPGKPFPPFTRLEGSLEERDRNR